MGVALGLRRLFWIGLWLATGLGLATALFTLGAWAWFAAGARDPADHPEADAIAILSAGLNEDGALDPFTAARIETGLALWRAGRAPDIVVSGGPDPERGKNVGEEMARALTAAGVPSARITVEDRAVSTFENARFVVALAETRGWRRLIIVTDDFHLARAGLLFRWWGRDGIRPTALVPAFGRRAVPAGRMTLAILREILAYPFNLLKLAGQGALSLTGRGDERIVR